MPIQPTNATGRAKVGRRRFRFGLRALMVGIAVCAVPLAMWRIYVMSYRAELRTITRIRSLSDGMRFESQVHTEPRGQYLFRQLFGDKLSQRAVYVHLHSEAVDDDWIKENLSGLRYVEVLTLDSPHVTDDGLFHLMGLTRLQRLYLLRTRVTEEGVEKLQRVMPDLKIVERRPSLPPNGPAAGRAARGSPPTADSTAPDPN